MGPGVYAETLSPVVGVLDALVTGGEVAGGGPGAFGDEHPAITASKLRSATPVQLQPRVVVTLPSRPSAWTARRGWSRQHLGERPHAAHHAGQERARPGPAPRTAGVSAMWGWCPQRRLRASGSPPSH